METSDWFVDSAELPTFKKSLPKRQTYDLTKFFKIPTLKIASTGSRITPINFYFFREIQRLFRELIKKSGFYSGSLNFESVNALEIEVKPREDSEYVPLSSLSGGEKSKTLACLIRAFWQFQCNPFR